MKDEDAIFKISDKIYLILYTDYNVELNNREDLKDFLFENRKNMHLLWVIGKIINENDKDPFYAVLSSGAFKRLKKPDNYTLVSKDSIIKKELILTLDDMF